MNNFADRLEQRIKEMKNPTVMGIDPLVEYVPASILIKYQSEFEDPMESTAMAVTEFACGLIDSVKGIIPAVKPQLAFYELLGVYGIRAFSAITRYAKQENFLVIADAKRGDILSTATAYAKAFLGKTDLSGGESLAVFDCDAMTVNPYFGTDGIQPFINECENNGKGIFILVRTSNPSAAELQDLMTSEGKPVYEIIAQRVAEWGHSTVGVCGFSSVGAVVGATWPKQAAILRKIMPHSLILVPGYGAQGGSADAAAINFTSDGTGAVVNASRSLMCAYKYSGFSPDDYREATYREALRMRDDLQAAISKHRSNCIKGE